MLDISCAKRRPPCYSHDEDTNAEAQEPILTKLLNSPELWPTRRVREQTPKALEPKCSKSNAGRLALKTSALFSPRPEN